MSKWVISVFLLTLMCSHPSVSILNEKQRTSEPLILVGLSIFHPSLTVRLTSFQRLQKYSMLMMRELKFKAISSPVSALSHILSLYGEPESSLHIT